MYVHPTVNRLTYPDYLRNKNGARADYAEVVDAEAGRRVASSLLLSFGCLHKHIAAYLRVVVKYAHIHGSQLDRGELRGLFIFIAVL